MVWRFENVTVRIWAISQRIRNGEPAPHWACAVLQGETELNRHLLMDCTFHGGLDGESLRFRTNSLAREGEYRAWIECPLCTITIDDERCAKVVLSP